MLYLDFIRTGGAEGTHHEEGTGSKHEEDHRNTHGHKGHKVTMASPRYSPPRYSRRRRRRMSGSTSSAISFPFFITCNINAHMMLTFPPSAAILGDICYTVLFSCTSVLPEEREEARPDVGIPRATINYKESHVFVCRTEHP